ncbi:MAG: SDR family NAD(P)-dependent oxidoreductase [Candidatus Nitrosocaldaceae archaeon]
MKFNNKTVVITGSGTGIGQAIAKKFAEEGANIIIMGRRREPLEKTKVILEEIIKNVKSNAKVRVFPGIDVSDEEGIRYMFETIKEELKSVDILVNNAGVSGPVKSFPAQPFNEFKECVAIHLTGTFRTSVHALRCMKEGSKIITIATYFTEERPYEQRPYRFRTPYTAAQGAKNRLGEALAWELVSKGIRSIVTNPGPVHSDRIYKTVYPKAAAEFLRIGGFPGLTSKEIVKIAEHALPFLGEDNLDDAIKRVAEEIVRERGTSNIDEIKNIVKSCLDKMQEIAEKIQNNTSKMIVDEQFLTQEETAELVINLADDTISRLINGRVIPADRVFYPVKPLIGCYIPNNNNVEGKFIIITLGTNEPRFISLAKRIVDRYKSRNAKCIMLLSKDNNPSILEELDVHAHIIDLSDESSVKRIFSIAAKNFGVPDLVIHITGNYDYNRELSSLSRDEWDGLVNRYINTPALISKEAINIMAPGALDEPSLYKDSKGSIIIIGPDAPVGKKIHGAVRARSEVFKGALRPLVSTINQELKEVLNSKIRVYLLFAGTIDGREPNDDRMIDTCIALTNNLLSEVIYYPDEV